MNVRKLSLLAVSAMLSAAGTASAQTVWTGGSGLNPWSNPANWTGTAPTDNASLDLVFGAVGATNTTTGSNDLTGLTATSITFNGNSLSYLLTGNALTLGGDITQSGGNNSIDLSLVLSGTRTFDVTGGSLSVGQAISGPGGIVKSGGGNVVLNASNIFTGPTNVNQGTLLVNNTSGSGTGTGTVTANTATATLGGSGTIAGAVTIGGGGTIRGGDANGVGTLTIQNGLTFNSSARATFRISDGSTPSASPGGSSVGGTTTPTSNNFIHVTNGGLTYSPADFATHQFRIDGTGTTFTQGQEYSYRVAQFLTSAGTPQDLSAVSLTGPSVQGLFSATGFDANNFSLTGDANGFLYAGFTPVPEPATILGLTAAALGFGGFLRRRKERECPAMAI